MLAHYFSLALRSFRRSPSATLINIVTLALGLVCFVTASAVVGYWARAEQHFPKADRTFVITASIAMRDGSLSSGTLPQTNPYVAQYLKADFQQIERVARVVPVSRDAAVSNGADRAVRLAQYSVDGEFLDIFDLPFIAGDKREALKSPRSVVLTEEAARQLYGDGQALGKRIVLGNLWECTVTGVVAAIPEPSHMGRSASASFRFDMLTSRDVYESALRMQIGRDTTEMVEQWINVSTATYVLLPEDGSLSAAGLREQLPAFVARHVPAEELRRSTLELGLIPVSDLLAIGSTGAGLLRDSGLSVSMVLWLLGAVVLAVACVNYANLATARSAGRAREVGLRKAVGAKAGQVMSEYLLEAALLTSAALLVALAVIALVMPVLDAQWGIDLRLSLLADAGSWATVLVLIAVVTLAAGAYPAFVLARTRPIFALRVGAARTGPRFLSTLLVGIQFAVTAFLLIAVTITYLQNAELERTGLGTTSAPLLVIENNTQLTNLQQNILRDELLSLPQVRSATTVQAPPWQGYGVGALARSPEAAAAHRPVMIYAVGDDFFTTFDIDMLAGRLLDASRRDDAAFAQPNAGQPIDIVIDRSLTEELGFSSPEAAIEGLVYSLPNAATGTPPQPYQIVGVVENKPLMVVNEYGPKSAMYLFGPELIFHVVKISADDISGALADIDALWQRLVPTVALNRRFVDEYFEESYETFAQINQGFTVLAGFALVIATIGLFAMALLIATRRAQEIGVRKTLGASTGSIVALLLRSFSKPVLIASLAAWPLAYLAAEAYLNQFINPIDLSPLPFVICLLFTLLIAWLAVGGQTWRAARQQPVDVLRSE